LRNSKWTGTFSVSITTSGELTGSATYQGDLNFTVYNLQTAGYTAAGVGSQVNVQVSQPSFRFNVLGSFRSTFTSNAVVPSHPNPGGGQFIGPSQTGSGSAVGDIQGSYDPSSNKVTLTNWITILKQASGSYADLDQGGKLTSYSVNNAVTAIDSPPEAYEIAGEEFAPDSPGVLKPVAFFHGDSLQPPIVLDLNNLGTQQGQVVQTVSAPWDYTQTGNFQFNLVPPKYTIDVEFDPTDLDPTMDPTSTMTVTVTENGQPSQNRDVDITVCTEIGGGSDGHIHDPLNRGDKCDDSRPPGSIAGPGNIPASNHYKPPLTKTTDSSGKISLTYTSPKSPNPTANASRPGQYGGTYYISGTDVIKSMVGDPTITDKTNLTNEQYLQTFVDGLGAMLGSVGGSGGQSFGTANYVSYTFSYQRSHGYVFYGTPATNQSVADIANEFINAQVLCQNGDYQAYGKNPQGNYYKTPGRPIPIIITAMSLPWGGLSDIYGDWNPPHATHNSGQQVDISFSNFAMTDSVNQQSTWDFDRLYLLQYIISQYPNFGSFGPGEGDDLSPGSASFTNPGGAHFHVNFKQ